MARQTEIPEDIEKLRKNFFAVAQAMENGFLIRVRLNNGETVEGVVCGSNMSNDGARQGVRHGCGDIIIQTTDRKRTIDYLDICSVDSVE